MDGGIYLQNKPIVIIQNRGKVDTFPAKIRNNTRMSIYPLRFSIVLYVLATPITGLVKNHIETLKQ